MVATASVFLLLLNGNTGAINNFLGSRDSWAAVADRPRLGQAGHRDHEPAWQVGSMVISLAALQNVLRELYEAAETDGASRLR